MGTYTSLRIGGYEILSTRGYADPVAMTLFTEADRYERTLRIDETGSEITIDQSLPKEYESDADNDRILIGYGAPVGVIRDRQEVLGFTLEATKKLFEEAIRDHLDSLHDWLNESNSSVWEAEIAVLESVSFDDWVGEFADLKERQVYSWKLHSWSENPVPVEVSEIGRWMLGDNSDDFHLGFPTADIRFLVRAAIEACSPHELIDQDLTGVIYAGYYHVQERVAWEARQSLLADFPANASIVVLTEGISDRRALEGSLQVLYPHLAEYYSFMDFEGARVAGGAGPLVAMVKAFAGAQIANKIVALFDNDTAAAVALRSLKTVSLPSSIRILQYPALPLASDYPTLGPSGLVHMDVNGLAASLELYFGEDVLREADGNFSPVQWRGFEAAVGQYQGEVLKKVELQQQFEAKLRTALANPQLVQGQDWSGMRAIVDTLRNAFAGAGAFETTGAADGGYERESGYRR